MGKPIAGGASNTITYPETEHLAKLHHAMKTALLPLFFLPSCNYSCLHNSRRA